MYLQYFYDKYLAQASYMVACPDTGEALIIDPARDIFPYLRAAEEQNFKIIGAAETHIHADFVSGGRELVTQTGGTLYLSKHGGDYGYQFSDDDLSVKKIGEGDTITIGNVRLDVLHTPGHTPEHIVFLVTDGGAEQPMGLFTGDCLFVGDVGRPDLLDATSGSSDMTERGAHEQYANLQRLKAMDDYLQVWPGHGAGSACGKALGSVPSSTLGYEKRFNPAFQQADEASFVRWLLEDQPEVPRYFKQMKKVNQRGAELLRSLILPEPLLDFGTIETLIRNEFVIDTRERQSFAQGHFPYTIAIDLNEKKFATWAGWYIDYDRPTYLVVHEDRLVEALARLRAIGVDNIAGYIPAWMLGNYPSLQRWEIDRMTPQEAAALQKDGAMILDVRSSSEREESHIPDSMFIPMGEVPERTGEIPKDRPLIVQCGSGIRSQLVSSLLQRYGFKNVINMEGGIDGWKKADLPIVS